MLVMAGYSSWSGIVLGVLAIIAGTHSLLRTGSVAGWLESHGVRHAPSRTAFQRQIKTLGVSFILVGIFFVSVAIRNG